MGGVLSFSLPPPPCWAVQPGTRWGGWGFRLGRWVGEKRRYVMRTEEVGPPGGTQQDSWWLKARGQAGVGTLWKGSLGGGGPGVGGGGKESRVTPT